MAKEEELQEKYIMLQLLDAQIKEIENELSAIENKNAELVKLKVSLNDLGNVKKDSKSYSAIGLGIYAESSIKAVNEVLVNVGSNILVKKDIGSAGKLIDDQLKQSEEIILKLAQNLQTLALRSQQLEKEIKGLAGE